jgi:gamma-glutamyltranspeptidase/glutathione hydrolase
LWLNFEAPRALPLTTLTLAAALGLAACAEQGPRDPVRGTAVSHGIETQPERQARMTGRTDRDSRLAPGFSGAAVADEPAAALAARQVLEQGGNAADAATAIYFTLSVTYPAAAGLGGGGICLVHDGSAKTVETVSFLAASPRRGGSIAVPGNVRGFAYIHARYGKAAWTSVVAPAERLAATGSSVSRAGAAQFAIASGIIEASPSLSRIFAPGGQIAAERDLLTQLELATTLGQIRARGATGFYAGPVARRFAEAVRDAGGAVSESDLEDYRPLVSAAQGADHGGLKVWFPSAGLYAGLFAAELWRDGEGADAAELAALTEKAAVRLGTTAHAGVNYGSTSFAAMDRNGGAVACAVTMNGLFGAGKIAGDTGVALAASPAGPAGLAQAFLAPVIATGQSGEIVRLTIAGAGGPNGAAAAQHVARNFTSDEAARAAFKAGIADLASPVNAIGCPENTGSASCILESNPQGFGMGVIAHSSAD